MAKVGSPRLASTMPTGPKSDFMSLEDEKIIDPVIDPILDDTKKKLNEAKTESKFEEFPKAAKIPPPTTQKFQGGRDQEKLFYDWMASLKPEHWSQLSWYMYRTWPRIDRPERERYIDIGTYPITEQWILENHGSGSYMFIVNVAGKPKGANKICQANIEKLDDPQYPPKINLAELDTSYPGNKFFVDRLIAEGKLRPDRSVANMTPQGGGLSDQIILKLIDKLDQKQLSQLKDPKDSAIQAAFDIIGQGNKASTQMMLDQMKENDPDKLVKLVETIFKLMPKPVEHKDDSTNQMMKFLEIMNKKDETIVGLMTKMMEAKIPTNNEDSFDKSLDRFTKLFELTGMLGGIGGGGKKSTLETVMQYTMPVAEKIFGTIQNLLAVRANAEAIKNGKSPSQTNQLVVSAASPQVNKAEGDEEIEEVSEAETPSNKKDVRSVMEQSGEEQMNLIRQGLKQIAPKILEAMSRNTSGSAFAEGIENFMGPAVYDQLAALGEDQIFSIIKSDQQLWSKLQPIEGKFKLFVKDFIAYGSDVVDETIESPISSVTKESKVGTIDEVVE